MARGPGYPYINLADAVGLARKLYDYSKRSPANLHAVIKDAWEYSPTSSSAVKIVAAMRYFGLVEVTESKSPDRQETVKITDRAYRILVDSEDSPERAKAVRDAMLAPKAYKMCWDTWGADLPPSMRSSLIFQHGFIDASVDHFLANYKKSLAYAGMLDKKNIGDDADDGKGAEKSALKSEDSDGSVVKSDATSQVKPDNQPKPQEPPLVAAAADRPLLTTKRAPDMRQEVFVLTEGDVTISFPETISPDSFEDFSDWLTILLRKMKRNVAKPAPEIPDSHE